MHKRHPDVVGEQIADAIWINHHRRNQTFVIRFSAMTSFSIQNFFRVKKWCKENSHEMFRSKDQYVIRFRSRNDMILAKIALAEELVEMDRLNNEFTRRMDTLNEISRALSKRWWFAP